MKKIVNFTKTRFEKIANFAKTKFVIFFFYKSFGFSSQSFQQQKRVFNRKGILEVHFLNEKISKVMFFVC